MKKMMQLGKPMSRQDQKSISGGVARVVCVCGNGTGMICLGSVEGCFLDGAALCAKSKSSVMCTQ